MPLPQDMSELISPEYKKQQKAVQKMMQNDQPMVSSEMQTSFEAVAKPVIKWLCDNMHPHCSVFITPVSAELNEGIAIVGTQEFLKD